MRCASSARITLQPTVAQTPQKQMWLIFFAILHVSYSSCTSGYELVRNGECRAKSTNTALYNDEATEAAIAQCQTVQGQLPIIYDDVDFAYWKSKEYWNIPIGLVCNTQSKLWEWVDGSPLDFKPPGAEHDSALDDDCTTGCVWYISDEKIWIHGCDHSETTFDIWCTTPVDKPAAKECDNFDDDNEDSACYQIGTAVANWQDAQIACRNYGADLASIHNQQENSFIRRLAVSKGTVNGVYLGATISGKASSFGWIDGTDWDYQNFFPGFPIDGLGDCLSMDTLGTTGQWMNIDCNTELAVACIRKPNTSYVDECSPGPWKEGQIIYSPGYPYDASVPCEYFLTVEAGNNVEVTIKILEANTCCDHLIITDSYLGGNILANLTGEVSDVTYRTWSSNLMRVSWQPNGGVNVRGFMMTYRSV